MYSRRKNLQKEKVTYDEGNDSLRSSNYVMAVEEGVRHARQNVGRENELLAF